MHEISSLVRAELHTLPAELLIFAKYIVLSHNKSAVCIA